MKIEVRVRGLDSSAELREHAVRRVRQYLSRFGGKLTSALIRIADVNGPRGGVDKRCQVTVTGHRGTSIAEELHADAYAAVELAVARIAAAVGSRVERARERRRVPIDDPRHQKKTRRERLDRLSGALVG